MSDSPATPPPIPGAVELKDPPAPTPPAPGAIRVAADLAYVQLVRGTAFLDHPTPPREPTESQKFRANVLVTFIGATSFGLLMFFIQDYFRRADAAIADGYRRSDAAIASNNKRLELLSAELKVFSDSMPEAILLTYKMSKLDALCRTQPQTAVDSDKAAENRTWSEVRAEFEEAREKQAKCPQADVLCQRVQLYLRTPAAKKEVEHLRKCYQRLFNATESGDVEESLRLTNTAWDDAMAALVGEFSP